jgi:hypothetical protein
MSPAESEKPHDDLAVQATRQQIRHFISPTLIPGFFLVTDGQHKNAIGVLLVNHHIA